MAVFDAKAGRAERDKGAEKVRGRDPEFHEHALSIIRHLAGQPGLRFSSDDVRQRLKRQPRHPNSIGAALLAARRMKLIERVGYTKSEVVSTHARVVAVYRGLI
jgi:hypothetical protein